VTSLLNKGLDVDAVLCSTALVERIRGFNRRSLDLLSSKAYFYFSLSYERIGKLENIRALLLTLFRTACVHQDESSQSVLLNLLLRNYLKYDLVEQALMLSKCVDFPESASNNQTCRYAYYKGRILAIQLDYPEACNQLKIAARKAPQESAVGFTVTVNKLIIIVQLLMGEIPERSLFNNPEFRIPLKPYFHLTQAVRNGDLQQFTQVKDKYTAYFKNDKCFNLVQRLGHNVLKTGLRKLSISYSRISLQDIADKLHLPSAASAEYVCAKAIR
jgi:26S proteasome regulatory subunit N3